ncbi:ATP-dependent DNA ligase [Curtobacterium sp. MCPF17_011]|uniref:DUF7882 family protein n=1 Tax=Curtobacterium sp. MCPF17_011 TaxID=2175652 RepID=UPI0015E899CD|nr:ATP-dependent DNA ligase [Curtobacterium sp. MCPF17_011]
MGSISYDGLIVFVDDRTLTHLQIVIVNKLRRGEAFLMSWKDAVDVGSGRSSIWLHPHVLVHFKFDGSRVPAINDRWLQELSASAASSRGLVVTSENGDAPNLRPKPTPSRRGTVLAPANAGPQAQTEAPRPLARNQ